MSVPPSPMSLSRAPLRLLQSSSSLSSSYASTFLESGLSSFIVYTLFFNSSFLSFFSLSSLRTACIHVKILRWSPKQQTACGCRKVNILIFLIYFCNKIFSKGRSGEGQEAPEKEWYQFCRRSGQVYQETHQVCHHRLYASIKSALSLSLTSDLLSILLLLPATFLVFITWLLMPRTSTAWWG